MSEKTLKSQDVIVNKNAFHAANSKQPIALSLVDIDKIVVSDKYDHSDNGSKCFIGYLDDDDDDNIVRPLRILLPQIIGYINYFDDGKKYVF